MTGMYGIRRSGGEIRDGKMRKRQEKEKLKGWKKAGGACRCSSCFGVSLVD